jgi:5-methyltetrahydropteroyltriglutamate--homocysteine methyltransferase
LKRSRERLLTTHVGSLPRPDDLWQLLDAKHNGRLRDTAAFEATLRRSVAAVVRRQAEIGVDVLTDGEMPKPTWGGYVRDRLGGFEMQARHATSPGGPRRRGSQSGRGRDEQAFPGYFAEGIGERWRPRMSEEITMVCTGPISYIGGDQVQRDIANLKAAAEAVAHQELFMASVGPDNVGYQPGINQHYSNEEDYIRANALAMREEYRAIVDAGCVLQIDTPVQKYNSLNLSLEEFRRRFAQLVDILNEVLADIPSDMVRLHICYGGTHHPHTGDIGLRDILDLVMKVRADGLSYDQNVRHEHEWKIWQEQKLPEGKVLIPGLVSHTSDVVEHPELVADRIVRLAKLVGRENVIASTDCGLGGRVYHEVAWAKLGSLVEGARLASRALW